MRPMMHLFRSVLEPRLSPSPLSFRWSQEQLQTQNQVLCSPVTTMAGLRFCTSICVAPLAALELAVD